MSESPDLQPLFVQLQTRYPTSGLLTELVQMHADRFVVRAIVQLGNMPLVTSLAAAPTVEAAEDQARLRVLALLGIRSMAPSALPAALPKLPTTFSSDDDQPQLLTKPSITKPLITKPPIIETLRDRTPSTAFDRLGQEPLAPQPAVDAAIAISSPVPLPTPSFEPSDLTKAALPLIVYPSDLALDPIDAPAYDDETFEPETFEPETFEPETFKPESFKPEAFEPETFETQSFEFESEPSEPPSFEPEPPDTEQRPPSLEPPTATTTALQGSKSKSRKPSTSKDASAVEMSSSASRDLSSLISQIGVEIDRIGWSKRQGSTYLQKTYGKKTRSELTDDELEDFLTYLNTQPSAGEGEDEG